uniref:Beta-alanine-activating enzyme-like isoform X1 n=1 Tax=Actinia tenebrosa TaxID=6105 RepID=A0A6P8HHV0_ACTTE
MAEIEKVPKKMFSPKSTISLDEMFSQAALVFPDNLAVTYINELKQEDLTYQEVDKKALQISSYLKTFCKLQNTVVGIYTRIMLGFIACMIGVLRIPAAFAPIGLDWPVKMVKQFIETSGVNVVVVNVDLLEKFNQVLRLLEGSNKTFRLITECEVLKLNGFVVAVANEPIVSPDYEQSLGYVMQTSGTTGSPTVVKVPHACIVPNITSLAKIFGMTDKDSVAVVSPYTFDPFIVQVFLALSSGGRAVVVSDAFKLQTGKLCQILFDDLKISLFQPTPYLMYLIGQERIRRNILGQQSPLRILAFGGESCPTLSVLQKWKHHNCETRLFNLYGITEVSSWASCFEITDKELNDKDTIGSRKRVVVEDEVMDINEDSVPLGFPLEDTILEVRDENGLKIDEGVGCIFIGGRNRVCYLGNETSFHPGTMRSTADLGYIEENKLWFIGRKNRSIKRQAKNISLDWLERSLSKAFPDFIFCAVADTLSDAPQNEIYLFVKPETSYNERPFLTSLKRELREAFPPYACPDYVGIVSTIPLTSHGKVDTRALLKNCREEKNLSLGESVEEILKNIWLNGITLEDDSTVASSKRGVYGPGEQGDQANTNRSTLDMPPQVESEDMFVEHGGSSLAALRVANEIKTWFHQDVGSRDEELSELVDVILNSSFGKLCAYIKARVADKSCNREGTIGENMVENTSASQGDFHLASADENENSSEFCTRIGITSKPSKNNDDREVKTSVSLKRRKIEDNGKHTHPTEAATGNFSCFCSIQRGMRATTCSSCTASGIHGGVEHSQGALEASLSLKWKTNFHKCIDASPLVVGTNDKDLAVVYLGSHAHVLKAVYLASGMILWETCLGDRLESSAALSKCGLYVIVGCYDGKVYVLNRSNGHVVWTYQTSGPVKSSPCVDPSTRLVWIGSHDHHLYALDVNQRDCIASIDCGSSCFSSPWILHNPHLVFIGTLGGRLFCVDASTQSIKWSKQCPQPIFSSPLATSQAVVYACVNGIVYCCDLDRKPLWEFKTGDPVFSSPTMFWSSVANESKGYVLFGSHDGFVYCLSDSGEMRWKFKTDSQVYSTPFVAPVVRELKKPSEVTDKIMNCSSHLQMDIPDIKMSSEHARNTSGSTIEGRGVMSSRNDPVVVVCSIQGTIYCLSLDEGHLVSSWSFPGQVFSSPILVGNDILVGCRDDFLYCLTIN